MLSDCSTAVREGFIVCVFHLVRGHVKCCCVYKDDKDDRRNGSGTTCMMVLGLAVLMPNCPTASTKRWFSLGVHVILGCRERLPV